MGRVPRTKGGAVERKICTSFFFYPPPSVPPEKKIPRWYREFVFYRPPGFEFAFAL